MGFLFVELRNFSLLHIGAIAVILLCGVFYFLLIMGKPENKEVRQLRQKGIRFAEEVNSGKKIWLMYHHLEQKLTAWSLHPPTRLDIMVDILPHIPCEFIIEEIDSHCQLPSKAYRLAVNDVQLKHNEDGTIFEPYTLRIFLCPASYCVNLWDVIKTEDNKLVLEHSLMGILPLSKAIQNKAKDRSFVFLQSRAEKCPVAKTWWLEYVPW